MAKKNTIRIERNDALKSIDDELDEAMGNLSGVNQRVSNLLESYEGGEPLPTLENDAAASSQKEKTAQEPSSPAPAGEVDTPETAADADEFDSDDEDEDEDEEDDAFFDEDD